MPRPLRVLILEDRPADAELMAVELERAGFQFEWQRVDTEADYLTHLDTNPDVILADHNLPQFDAPRALDRLTERGLDIPFIVVTGSISEEVAVQRIKQGAADYLLKDRMARLGHSVMRALEEKKLREKKRRAEADLQARYKELETLQEISQTILTSPNLKTTLEKILDKVVSVGSFDLGTILLADSGGKRIETAASCGYQDPANIPRQPVEQTPERARYRTVNRALADKKTLVIENIAEIDGLRTLKKKGARSAILVPVRTEEDVLGFIQLGSRAQRKFEPDLVRLLEAMGSQMGIAIQKHRLYEETQRSLERMRALYEIDKAITSTLDLNTVLDVLLEKMDLFFSYPFATTVRLYDPNTRELRNFACRNLNREEWESQLTGPLAGRAKVVIETKAPLIIRNIQTDPQTRNREFFRKEGLVSYLSVPLIAKDNILGLLSFYTKQEHEFSREEVDFLKTLAGQTAIAIHNSQLYDHAKKQALALEKSNKVKDEFLSIMSHELRTPLTGVMGYAGMIKDGLLGQINPQQEEALGKIEDRVNDQLGLINNILFATVLEAGEVKVESEEVSLGDLLGELRSNYERHINKELTLKWDYRPDLPNIKTDSTKLKQILRNLIDNAIKFTERGQVTISARLIENGRQSGQGDEELQFKVVDTGIGISKEHLALIFEKLRQVDSSQTRLHGGAGIGLYIVKKFTEMLGGTVDVESEPAKGSTFTVTLPLHREIERGC
jgi:signal transduction histidine kinase/FixJ family two-component response regulator